MNEEGKEGELTLPRKEGDEIVPIHPKGLTRRVRESASLLITPRTKSLVPLTKEEKAELDIHRQTALELRRRTSRLFTEKTGDFKEIRVAGVTGITNITETDIDALEETGRAKTEKILKGTSRLTGLFSMAWEIRTDTQTGQAREQRKRGEKLREEKIETKEEEELRRETVTGRHLTGEDITQYSRSIETTLEAGAIFTPSEALRLINGRQAFFAQILREFAHRGDRPDLVQAVAMSAYEITRITLDNLQYGLPQETVQRVDKDTQAELLEIYRQLTWTELIQGFETLISASDSLEQVSLVSKIVSDTFEFNEQLGNRLLARWAMRLPTLSSDLQAAFFNQYAQMFKIGVETHHWDNEPQLDFTSSFEYCWPFVTVGEIPIRVKDSLQRFFVKVYRTTTDDSLRLWLVKEMYEVGSDKAGSPAWLIATNRLPLSTNTAWEIAASFSQDLLVEEGKKPVLEKKGDVFETVGYFIQALGEEEVDSQTRKIFIQAMKERFLKKEWFNTRLYTTQREYEESIVPIAVTVELGHGEITSFTPQAYQEIVQGIPDIGKYPVYLKKFTITFPYLPHGYSLEDLNNDYYSKEIFSLEDLNTKALQRLLEIPLSPRARNELKSKLPDYLDKKFKWLANREGGIFLLYSSSYSWKTVKRFFELLPQLRAIVGDEEFGRLSGGFLSRLVTDGGQEAEIGGEELKEFGTQLERVDLGFGGRKWALNIQKAREAAEESLATYQRGEGQKEKGELTTLEEIRRFWLKMAEADLPLEEIFKSCTYNLLSGLLGKRLPKKNDDFLKKVSKFVAGVHHEYVSSCRTENLLGIEEQEKYYQGAFYSLMSTVRKDLAEKFIASTGK